MTGQTRSFAVACFSSTLPPSACPRCARHCCPPCRRPRLPSSPAAVGPGRGPFLPASLLAGILPRHHPLPPSTAVATGRGRNERPRPVILVSVAGCCRHPHPPSSAPPSVAVAKALFLRGVLKQTGVPLPRLPAPPPSFPPSPPACGTAPMSSPAAVSQ